MSHRGVVEFESESGRVAKLRVAYLLDDAWRVALEWDLAAPSSTTAGGPTSLTVEAYAPDAKNGELGGWDSPGVQQALLRSIPLAEMRDVLRTAWIEVRAAEVVERVPDDFDGEVAFARLADVMTELVGLNVRNPIGVITRIKGGKHSAWATRVRRAKDRGFLTPDFGLTPKSRALLGG